MLRPNLAKQPFLDTRPVVVTGAVLAVAALALTLMSTLTFLAERGHETKAAENAKRLEGQRDALAAEVRTLDRELAGTPWKKLRAETASMQHIVVQHRLLWGPLFADLERVLPWDTRLSSIVPQVDEDGIVTVGLTGIATNRSAWLRLLGRMFTDTHFSEPLPLSEQAPGESNTIGFRFVLRVKYWPDGRPR